MTKRRWVLLVGIFCLAAAVGFGAEPGELPDGAKPGLLLSIGERAEPWYNDRDFTVEPNRRNDSRLSGFIRLPSDMEEVHIRFDQQYGEKYFSARASAPAAVLHISGDLGPDAGINSRWGRLLWRFRQNSIWTPWQPVPGDVLFNAPKPLHPEPDEKTGEDQNLKKIDTPATTEQKEDAVDPDSQRTAKGEEDKTLSPNPRTLAEPRDEVGGYILTRRPGALVVQEDVRINKGHRYMDGNHRLIGLWFNRTPVEPYPSDERYSYYLQLIVDLQGTDSEYVWVSEDTKGGLMSSGMQKRAHYSGQGEAAQEGDFIPYMGIKGALSSVTFARINQYLRLRYFEVPIRVPPKRLYWSLDNGNTWAPLPPERMFHLQPWYVEDKDYEGLKRLD